MGGGGFGRGGGPDSDGGIGGGACFGGRITSVDFGLALPGRATTVGCFGVGCTGLSSVGDWMLGVVGAEEDFGVPLGPFILATGIFGKGFLADALS